MCFLQRKFNQTVNNHLTVLQNCEKKYKIVISYIKVLKKCPLNTAS